MEFSQNMRYVACGITGSLVGFITSCIFLLLYYGMEFSAPVIEHMRFNTALIDTALIVVVTPIAFYMALNTIRMVVSDDAEDESQENPDEE